MATELVAASEISSHIILQGISPALGRPAIVDNRPAVEAAAKAPPGGYSLPLYGSQVGLLQLMRDKTLWESQDFVLVTLTTTVPHLLVVYAPLPFKSVRLGALAVASAKSSVLIPDPSTVPAAGLPGYQSVTILGLQVQTNTPDAIFRCLNQAIA